MFLNRLPLWWMRLLAILVLTLIFMSIPRAYLGDRFPLCVWTILTGQHCLGCGSTRAFWSVLHLDFATAWNYNHLVVVTFPILSLCIADWIFGLRAKVGATTRKVVGRK